MQKVKTNSEIINILNQVCDIKKMNANFFEIDKLKSDHTRKFLITTLGLIATLFLTIRYMNQTPYRYAFLGLSLLSYVAFAIKSSKSSPNYSPLVQLFKEAQDHLRQAWKDKSDTIIDELNQRDDANLPLAKITVTAISYEYDYCGFNSHGTEVDEITDKAMKSLEELVKELMKERNYAMREALLTNRGLKLADLLKDSTYHPEFKKQFHLLFMEMTRFVRGKPHDVLSIDGTKPYVEVIPSTIRDGKFTARAWPFTEVASPSLEQL
jgi:hypothetical protein